MNKTNEKIYLVLVFITLKLKGTIKLPSWPGGHISKEFLIDGAIAMGHYLIRHPRK